MPSLEPPKIVIPPARISVEALIAAARKRHAVKELSQEGGTTSALRNEAAADGAHRRGLRDSVAKKIVHTLWGELVILAVLMLLQGFKLWGFELNEWVFGLFVNGVLLQTFFTVKIIVKNLFPDGLQSGTDAGH